MLYNYIKKKQRDKKHLKEIILEEEKGSNGGSLQGCYCNIEFQEREFVRFPEY